MHGSGSSNTPVEVVFEAFPGCVVVEIADAGPGFAAAAPVEGPLVDLDADLPEHGLGLPLVRALADELEIGTRPGGDGCLVRLVKRAQAA